MTGSNSSSPGVEEAELACMVRLKATRQPACQGQEPGVRRLLRELGGRRWETWAVGRWAEGWEI